MSARAISNLYHDMSDGGAYLDDEELTTVRRHTPVRVAGPLADADKANFETLREACGNGDLALLSAIRKSDGKNVSLVCAMSDDGEGNALMVPLAVMVEGDPFEDFEPPR